MTNTAEALPPDEKDVLAHELVAPSDFDTFWAHGAWREKTGLSTEQATYLWNSAQLNYHPSATAHDFSHARQVLWDAYRWADDYEQAYTARPPLKRKLLYGAALFHDAGSDLDYAQLGYETAEALAGDIFLQHGGDDRSGLDNEEIISSFELIMTTSPHIQPSTPEGVIMSIADLHTIGGEATVFRRRSQEFLEEARSQLADKFDESAFAAENILRLATFVTKSLSLDGLESEWLERARNNVRQRVAEFAECQKVTLPECIRILGSTALDKLFAGQSDEEPGQSGI